MTTAIDIDTMRAEAGARLRDLLSLDDQQAFISFLLAVSEAHKHTQDDPAALLERVEAEACTAVNLNDMDVSPTGVMVLATISAEPEGVAVVLANVVAFWQTGKLPPRWTA